MIEGGGTGTLRRRTLLGAAFGMLVSPRAHAFGPTGVFNPRLIKAAGQALSGPRRSAPRRWSWELVRRTSAPAQLAPTEVSAGSTELYEEPFAIWAGDRSVPDLTQAELKAMRTFIRLGGVLVVDDADPDRSAFGNSVRRLMTRIVPDAPLLRLEPTHVIFKSYYMLDRPTGRILGSPYVEAIVRGSMAQVILLKHDLLGALARTDEDTWALPMASVEQREYAIRFAVNLAMYVLCSDYKDDQVHAPWLMRRRAQQQK